MVRYLLEGLAAYEQDPGRLLDELSRLVTGRLGEAAFVTAFLAVIDRNADALEWTSADTRRRSWSAPTGRSPRSRTPIRRSGS